MASNSSSPVTMRFTFSPPAKPVMEFTGGNGDSSTVDWNSHLNPSHIQLYTYDWTIANYSMIKPKSKAVVSPVFFVGPCKNMELKLILSSNGDDNMKIEAVLSKETKQTDEMRNREANCPLSSLYTKFIFNLEFLDSTGKTVNYYNSLSSDFRYVNTSKVFTWTKEENVSRFIYVDSLTLRAKLGIRFYDVVKENLGLQKSTKVLMDDLKNLFGDRSQFADVLIKVGGQFVLGHRAIMYTQCPYFAKMSKSSAEMDSSEQGNLSLKLPSVISEKISDDYQVLYIPNENVDVFLSVLHFIYSKQLYAPATVNDFAVYEFAKKYGVRELSMLLMPSEIKVRSEIKVEKLNFTWYLKNFSSLRKGGFAPTQSPEFKTVSGKETITWSVILFHLDPQNIVLNLQRNSGLNADVQTVFKLAVCKADGSIHDERDFKHSFSAGTIKNCHPGLMESDSRFHITPDLLFNDTLAVCCDLAVSGGDVSSNIKYCYPSDHPEIDLIYWINNFAELLQKEYFSDATFVVEEKEFKVHKAILSARSPVFARMFESDMEEKRSGCARIQDISCAAMQKALQYIYTGKMEDLAMAHAPELYRFADKYEMLDLKKRCSEFIVHNLDAENACEIVILADLFSDDKLKKAAKNVVCCNAAQALLSPHGMELMTHHTSLAQDILETLSAVFCSLPPQEDIITKFKNSLTLSLRRYAVPKTIIPEKTKFS